MALEEEFETEIPDEEAEKNNFCSGSCRLRQRKSIIMTKNAVVTGLRMSDTNRMEERRLKSLLEGKSVLKPLIS